MTATTKASGPAPGPESAAASDVFKASGGRKLALTAIMALLLPFFLSMPAMILWRASRGLTVDAVALGIGALVFGLSMLFLLVHVINSHRQRIEVGPETVTLKVPKFRGPTPGFRYHDRTLPLTAIERVETRGEVYRELGVPTLMRTATVVTKDGERLPLGYAHETNEDPAFPVSRMAELIAERAKVPLVRKDDVQVGSSYRALLGGLPGWDKAGIATEASLQMSAAQYQQLKSRNHWLMFYLALTVIGLAVIGFIADLGAHGVFNQPI